MKKYSGLWPLPGGTTAYIDTLLRCLLLLSASLICLGSHRVVCEESGTVDWGISVLDTYVYDLNVNRKEADFRWYFSFYVNSSFETGVVYIPKTLSTHVYYGENISGNWHNCIIDFQRRNLDISSPNQNLYPFDKYVIKILIGFNVSLETEDFNEKISKANFEIGKDIEPYWVLKRNINILGSIPNEYSVFLKDTNKTVLQIKVTLTRKIGQWLSPFILYWLIPIIIPILIFLAFLLLKREHELKISYLLGVITAIVPLIGLLNDIQGKKPPCITVVESIIMVALGGVIVLPLVLILASKKEESKRSEISLAYPEPKFDLQRFTSNLENFKAILDDETRYKLLERMRDQAINLPHDGLPSDIRNVIIEFLLILKDKIESEKMRPLCLSCLSIIYDRRDNVVNAKMKDLFLNRMEKICGNLTMEEKTRVLRIRQRFRNYDFEFMRKLLTDAVWKWETDEFEALYNSIEFDKLGKEAISELKKLLWKWRAEVNQRNDKEKVERIDKILDLSVFR